MIQSYGLHTVSGRLVIAHLFVLAVDESIRGGGGILLDLAEARSLYEFTAVGPGPLPNLPNPGWDFVGAVTISFRCSSKSEGRMATLPANMITHARYLYLRTAVGTLDSGQGARLHRRGHYWISCPHARHLAPNSGRLLPVMTACKLLRPQAHLPIWLSPAGARVVHSQIGGVLEDVLFWAMNCGNGGERMERTG